MSLKATITNGKIQVKVDKDREVTKTFTLKESTIEKINTMNADWNVTTSEALDFIVKTFYELYDNNSDKDFMSEREKQKKEKEERLNKTIELRALNVYTRRELAEIVGVSKNTMDTYISEINKRECVR